MASKKAEAVRAACLVALMIGSVVAGTVAFAGATGASGTDSDVDGAAVAQTGPQFAENSSFRRVSLGDHLREGYTDMDEHLRRPYVIDFGDASTVTVVIDPEGNSGDYYGDVTIEDTDGDGEAKLLLNTWEMGHYDPFEVVGGEITRWDQTEFEDDDRLLAKTKADEQDAYDVLLIAGDDPSGDFSDNARLRVEEAETEEFNVMTAASTHEIDGPSDIWDEPHIFGDPVPGLSEEIQTGDWENPPSVAKGDTLVLAPWGGGYYGPFEHALDETNGDEEAAFLWLVENGYYEFVVHQLNNPDGNNVFTAESAKVLDLERAIEQGDLEVYSADKYYHMAFVLDTSTDALERDTEDGYVEVEAGDKFVNQFAKSGRADHDTNRDIAESGELFERYQPRIYDYFTVVEPDAWVDPLPTGGPSDATISGSTTLSPGTELTVTVEAGDVTTEETTIVTRERDEYGDARWNVTADISDAESSDDIRVEVLAENLDPKWVDEREPPEEDPSPEEQIEDLQGQLDDVEAQLEEVEDADSVEELTTRHDEMKSRIDDVEAQIDDVDGADDVEELVAAHETLQSDYDELETDLEEANAELEDANERIDELESETDESDDVSTETESADAALPGFGFLVALVAVLAVAGLAARNRSG